MKKTIASLLWLAVAGQASAATWVYVSNADSQEISVLALDRDKGTLTPVQTLAVGGTVMPMVVSHDKRVLYAALRSQPFRVASMSIDAATGKLQKLGEAPLADSMANIDLDASGKWLFAASYQGGKISVNAIGKDGTVGAIQQLVQTGPNAHAIHADAANRYVLATSLGGDNISSWRFDAEKGLLSPNDPALTTTAAKAGPRHFVWDKAQRHVYLLDELDAALHVFAWDAARGTLKLAQSTTTLPAGFSGKPWAADLHLTPDGRYLYASERTSSTLSAFKVDAATGQLQPLGQTPTEKGPRGFAIDPSGRYLIAAGQESHSISLYAIDAATGALGKPERLAVGKNPNWIEIVDLP
ncbi:6-phosphogluconolactonase [Variovorax boronicumulans]|uniref:lactonase family protein n=1 Tax=Variovorax boronicumulans TaxID=436515 RepID=UPI00278410C7|nr:beta-propeller fold lactonase family protein [Variovorax boronicumulans]MDQ0032565.1 6-phosphogluconolactonase [Variovorax boronicumulans]MDQ0040017.1 6-phosphogluconolactonase [Variovorax boronicumulans]